MEDSEHQDSVGLRVNHTVQWLSTWTMDPTEKDGDLLGNIVSARKKARKVTEVVRLREDFLQ